MEFINVLLGHREFVGLQGLQRSAGDLSELPGVACGVAGCSGSYKILQA